MTEINLCSPTQGEQDREINLCSTEQEEQDREINLCPSECPVELPALFLTGPAEPIDGDTYTATGGVEPYIFSTTCGTISSEGVLTGVNSCCDAGTVTVVDKCGQSKSVAVDFGDILEFKGSFGWQTDVIANFESGDVTKYYPPNNLWAVDGGPSFCVRATFTPVDGGDDLLREKCNWALLGGYDSSKNYYAEMTGYTTFLYLNRQRWYIYFDAYEILPCT